MREGVCYEDFRADSVNRPFWHLKARWKTDATGRLKVALPTVALPTRLG
jgi:hypothetical protein